MTRKEKGEETRRGFLHHDLVGAGADEERRAGIELSNYIIAWNCWRVKYYYYLVSRSNEEKRGLGAGS